LPGEYAIANGDPSVNIESQAADVAFALYPNPAQYELTIQGYVQEAQQVQIQFLDQAGRLIKSLSRVLNTGEFLLTEDIQDLKNGQYVMSIVGEEGELLDSTGFQVRR